MRKAVFLDRDGVLTQPLIRCGRPFSARTIDELIILPKTREALEALHCSGYILVVVTNQPDVSRGKVQRDVLEEMHRNLGSQLPIDAIETCEHDDDDRCTCRKPLPGLLSRSAERYRIDLAASFMVGDRWRDIEAGRSAGCRTVLIGDGYVEGLRSQPDATVRDLTDAVEWILAQSGRREGA